MLLLLTLKAMTAVLLLLLLSIQSLLPLLQCNFFSGRAPPAKQASTGKPRLAQPGKKGCGLPHVHSETHLKAYSTAMTPPKITHSSWPKSSAAHRERQKRGKPTRDWVDRKGRTISAA